MHAQAQIPFIEKYRPTKLTEIVGQDKGILEVRGFFKEYPKKKALLLHGSPGTGKTTLAWAIAKEFDLDVFELNASDLRNRLKLDEILRPASMQQSLFKKGKVLLMDEIDGVTGTDKGGIPELIRIIANAAHPLILTGNDIWQSKFAGLRSKCKLVELKQLEVTTITEVLKKVCEKEGKKENENFLRQIALKSQGDLRAALNDLQTYVADNTQLINFDEKREREDTIFNILKVLFQERGDALNLFDNTKMSLDEVLLWIEENIPREYADEALAKAYLALAHADRFRGRIYRQQFWRFLIYQNIFQSAGISYAKSAPIKRFTKYERPQRILKIWLNNQKTLKKKTIAHKYARHVHCSIKRAMRDFPMIVNILKANPAMYDKLKLDDEEIAFLQK